MDFKIQIFFSIAIIMYLILIIHLLRKKKLELKYTLLWLIAAVVLLIVILCPNLVYFISDILGIQTPINSAIVLGCMFIIMILITLTSIVSLLNRNLRVLTQEVALLQKKVKELSEKGNEESHE